MEAPAPGTVTGCAACAASHQRSAGMTGPGPAPGAGGLSNCPLALSSSMSAGTRGWYRAEGGPVHQALASRPARAGQKVTVGLPCQVTARPRDADGIDSDRSEGHDAHGHAGQRHPQRDPDMHAHATKSRQCTSCWRDPITARSTQPRRQTPTADDGTRTGRLPTARFADGPVSTPSTASAGTALTRPCRTRACERDLGASSQVRGQFPCEK